MKVYIAGALFNEGEIRQRRIEGEKLKERFPFLEVFNPIEAPFNADHANLATPETIFSEDYQQLISSDIIIADLTNEDAGTIMELGIAIEHRLPIIIGVNSDIRLEGSRKHQYPSIGMNHFVLGGLLKFGHLATNFDEALDKLNEALIESK